MTEATEKGETVQVTPEPQVTEEPKAEVARPVSSEPDNEKPEANTTSSFEDAEEKVPHLHAKTFLIVFAVCLIYFAQLINVVGAGAVRRNPSRRRYHEVANSNRSVLKISLPSSVAPQRVFG
jgi:hypothetical protein